MNDLALHIEYLLLRHDCVIVPGLGAFLAHSSGATLSADGLMLMPPGRSLGFNAELRHNDGLLAGSVARRRSLSCEAARVEVERCVESFLYQLHEAGVLPVGNLGTISVDSSTGALLFDPAVGNSVIALPVAGLENIALHPVADEPELPVAVSAPRRRVRFGRMVKTVASMIVALVVIGIAFNRSTLPAADRHELASIDSGLRGNLQSRVVPAEESPEVHSHEILLNIARPASESAAPTTTLTPVQQRYLLVVGSFPTRAAAERFMNAENGLDVVEMDGNYRVYAATAATIAVAREQASALSSTYPNIWICRR